MIEYQVYTPQNSLRANLDKCFLLPEPVRGSDLGVFQTVSIPKTKYPG